MLLYQDLVRSSAAASLGDPGEILQEILAAHDLVQVLLRRLCGDPSEMLSEASA